MDVLELRLFPATNVPDFGWLFDVSHSRDFDAFGAGDGGGPRVELYANGHQLLNVFAFEDSQRGGATVSLHDVDGDGDLDLLVGAGPGGGPVVVTYTNDHGFFHETSRVFIGDPGFRGGVALDNGFASLGAVFHGEYVLSPDDVLKATPYPGQAPNLNLINRELDQFPLKLQTDLVSAGLVVYGFTGESVTDLPEFADLKGLQTAANADGNRTYDQLPAAATWNRVYIRADTPWPTKHEVFHTTEWLLAKPYPNPDWQALVQKDTESWETDYERFNEVEAWAESGARLISGGTNPPGVSQFISNALGL